MNYAIISKQDHFYKKMAFFFMTTFILCFFSINIQGEQKNPESTLNVLVLHSYHPSTNNIKTMDGLIRTSFDESKDGSYEIFTEYLDELNTDISAYEEVYVTYLQTKYKNRPFDGIICVDQSAFEFISNYYDVLFDGIPVVHIGVDALIYETPASNLIEGVKQEIPFEAIFASAKRLNPNLKKMNIYTNSELFESKYENTLKQVSDRNRVLYQVYSEAKAERYLQDIGDMTSQEAGIVLTPLDDKYGVTYSLDDIFDIVDQLGDVQIYSTESYYVGKGAVGAILYDQEQYVAYSTHLLRNRMSSDDTQISMTSNPIIPTIALYDYQKIKDMALDYSNLPEDAIYVNKPSLMILIKDHLLEFIILALVVISIIMMFSIFNLALRLKAEKERETTRLDLENTNFELQAAYQQLMASESELSRHFKELKLKEEELRSSRERYRLAAKGSEFGIWDYDYELSEMYFSNKAKEILSLPFNKRAFVNAEYYDCVNDEERLRLKENLENHINHLTDYIEHETYIEKNDGTIEWISLRGKALFDIKGAPLRIAGSIRNITQEKEAKNEIKRIAFTDELTSLPNRAYFNQLVKTLGQCRTCKAVTLLLIDLDDFKVVNDSLGHHYGDQALKMVTKILLQDIKSPEELIRMGGDEFVILMPNPDSVESVYEKAKGIITAFDEKLEFEGIGFQVTLSIGIASYPEDSTDLEMLLKHADLALHEAKKRGKNQSYTYVKELESIMNENLWFERELKNALEEEQFQLFYQPKLELSSQKIVGYEALIRWNHPEVGMIPPSEFIPIAEEKGYISAIGEWVFNEAVKQLNEWHIAGHTSLTMSINLSAKQFKEVNLIDYMTQALKNKVIKAHHIELEITETTALHDVNYAMELLKVLRTQGFKISLDDFGTGYSSLNYLNILPIDILKIDRSFIEGCVNNLQREQIIKTVIQLAHANGMEVVAEGVESLDQLLFLQSECCDIIQGFYISKPQPPLKALELMNKSFDLIEA